MVVILFCTALYKSVFSTYHFIKLGFSFSVFNVSLSLVLVSVSLVFRFFIQCFEFNVILEDLITFRKSASIINHIHINFALFVLTLYKRSVQELCYKKHLEAATRGVL